MKITNTKGFVSFLKAELGLEFVPAVRTSWNFEKTETFYSKVFRADFQHDGKGYCMELYWALGSIDHIWFVWVNPAEKQINHIRDDSQIHFTTSHTVVRGKYHQSQLDQLIHYARLALAKLKA